MRGFKIANATVGQQLREACAKVELLRGVGVSGSLSTQADVLTMT
jgi:hypothetical protein